MSDFVLNRVRVWGLGGTRLPKLPLCTPPPEIFTLKRSLLEVDLVAIFKCSSFFSKTYEGCSNCSGSIKIILLFSASNNRLCRSFVILHPLSSTKAGRKGPCICCACPCCPHFQGLLELAWTAGMCRWTGCGFLTNRLLPLTGCRWKRVWRLAMSGQHVWNQQCFSENLNSIILV